jgi:hypothetical protein
VIGLATAALLMSTVAVYKSTRVKLWRTKSGKECFLPCLLMIERSWMPSSA